jgi:hypothetical protein
LPNVAKRQLGSQVVAAAGVEPARSCEQRILNPSRLPIPPRRQIGPRNLQDGTSMRLYFCRDRRSSVHFDSAIMLIQPKPHGDKSSDSNRIEASFDINSSQR